MLTRRGFLASAAAAGAAPWLAGFPQAKGPILGEGKHRYEWIPGWAKLPEGKTFAPTHGCVQVDSRDRVYVNTDNADAVMIFEPDGTFVKAWGKDISGGSAHGMTIVKESDHEVVYIAHTGRHRVYKATLDGQVLMSIPWPEAAGIYKKEGDYQPTMVSIAPGGDIYVAAGYGNPNSFIHRFDSAGKYVSSWNGKDAAEKPLNNVHGVWVDTRGSDPIIVAADRGNGRLVNFTPDGKFLTIVIKGLPAPCKVYIRDSDVLIPNLRGGVTILDKDNKLVSHLGENSNPKFRGNFGVKTADFKDGEFTAPHGACWDSKGDMYVEDWNQHGRLSKLRRIA